MTYYVTKELSIDIGSTTFTLHTGDIFYTDDKNIVRLEYKIKGFDGIFADGKLDLSNKSRMGLMVRIGSGWYNLESAIKMNIIEDITLIENRNHIIDNILL